MLLHKIILFCLLLTYEISFYFVIKLVFLKNILVIKYISYYMYILTYSFFFYLFCSNIIKQPNYFDQYRYYHILNENYRCFFLENKNIKINDIYLLNAKYEKDLYKISKHYKSDYVLIMLFILFLITTIIILNHIIPDGAGYYIRDLFMEKNLDYNVIVYCIRQYITNPIIYILILSSCLYYIITFYKTLYYFKINLKQRFSLTKVCTFVIILILLYSIYFFYSDNVIRYINLIFLDLLAQNGKFFYISKDTLFEHINCFTFSFYYFLFIPEHFSRWENKIYKNGSSSNLIIKKYRQNSTIEQVYNYLFIDVYITVNIFFIVFYNYIRYFSDGKDFADFNLLAICVYFISILILMSIKTMPPRITPMEYVYKTIYYLFNIKKLFYIKKEKESNKFKKVRRIPYTSKIKSSKTVSSSLLQARVFLVIITISITLVIFLLHFFSLISISFVNFKLFFGCLILIYYILFIL
jgi:hypothetical protein